MNSVWTLCAVSLLAVFGCVEAVEDYEHDRHSTRAAALAGAGDLALASLGFPQAAQAPVTTPLTELSATRMVAPMRLAVAADGRIAVSDARARRVFVFKANGEVDFDRAVYAPAGIAFDDQGILYVGDGVGAVQRFGTNGAMAGFLGFGNGEFGVATDLAWDNSAHIMFVADSARGKISAYSPNGQKLYDFGEYGSADGQMRTPIGLTIHEVAGLIYVIDLGNKHVEVFERTGTWLTSFGNDGSNDHPFGRPYGISMDSGGRVYVADIDQGLVHIFDAQGVHLDDVGSMGSGYCQLLTPTDVFVDQQDRLFVPSYQLGRIAVFGIADPGPRTFDAAVVVTPGKINASSNGRWATAYVEVPAACASQLVPESLELAGLPIAEDAPTTLGDFDDDGVLDLMVKFDRGALVAALGDAGTYVVDLTGTMVDGTTIAAATSVAIRRTEHVGIPGAGAR